MNFPIFIEYFLFSIINIISSSRKKILLSIFQVKENVSNEKNKHNMEEQFYGHFVDLDIDD